MANDNGKTQAQQPAERELKMTRTVGDRTETHGVMEGEWAKNGEALKKDGWVLVQ